MTNKGGKRRGRVKDVPFAQEPPEEATERADDALERQWTTYLQGGVPQRIVVRIQRTRRGEVVGWFTGQQAELDGQWVPVVEYDCAHGSDPHRHLYRRSKGKKGFRKVGKKKLKRGGSLVEIHDEVLDVLFREYEENLRRFMDG